MKNPSHWEKRGVIAWLLLPLSWLYSALVQWRLSRVTPLKVSVPVICVGNNTAGGAGKTPTTIALCEWLRAAGRKPAVISRGYRGHYAGTVQVDPNTHSAEEVGDEPLLIARSTPCFVSRRRASAARAAIAEGADVIVMDDGLQNTSLIKDASLLVVDGTHGFGNGFGLPAGASREPVQKSVEKADAVLVIGEPKHRFIAKAIPQNKPTFYGKLEPLSAEFKGQRVHPFAGIAYPDKFFRTLEEMGAEITLVSRFPDHHYYTQKDIDRLLRESAQHEAHLVTTEKDYVKLPEDFRAQVKVLPVKLAVTEHDALLQLLMQRMNA